MSHTTKMPGRTIPMGFVEKASQRYVRNGNLMVTSGSSEFFTCYDYPVIEEVRGMLYEQDKRIALLKRDLFDYISHLQEQGVRLIHELGQATPEELARPKQLKHVTYGSDVDSLEIPFNPKLRQYFIFSRKMDGARVFTVNLNYAMDMPVQMTAPPDEIGEVEMYHKFAELPELLEFHSERLKGKHKSGPSIVHDAIDTLDNLLLWSRHLK